LVLSVLEGRELGTGEGLEEVLSQDAHQVFAKLRRPIIVSTRFAAHDSDSTGSALSAGTFVNSILGAAGRLLNQTTWWVMKDRCGVVGANGVAQAVRDLRAKHAKIRIHLVGHSLGGRLIAACAKSLSADPTLQPDSVMLLEAAFSHYGFSADAGDGDAGFFRDVISKRVVRGPLVATFSAMDTVVGHIYALASRVADDNLKAIGDANDRFGGIGRNGAQKTTESVSETLHDVGVAYSYRMGAVNNLDGSANLIINHGDVTNERVTYAFASAIAIT
jgi:pimeloyl-ACP methyl ester carboxylesterase